ncbi:ABC transporter ATP-binding protein [Methanosalsum natronophilum]|uniref:ATP-binding cassette domain-containing protein n=1 Tax=Methanosalsum natronophilum TaxID=768733 RepID=A0A3R7XTS8_9EURY|nr:ATP-binding cassette domain-containing protein [Methanosalsum natronophilum]MCS3923254.1 putative ABC transport system ATP-binding protein [Methanosalsum natronophilum]RQD83855.1 MAG: ATP-binding cassette domain-containing protein [Methanosalsum natronophilum]
MTTVLVEYKDVTVSFNNEDIVKKFNLKLKKGEKVLFKGKSGTGKSTLLKLLMGFTFPSLGSINFRGKSLNCDNIWEVRKNVCYISQHSDVWEGPVIDIFKEIFSYNNNAQDLDYSKIDSLMNYFNLDKNKLYQEYDSLSGGEKQRICIILAILLPREIYLLDEITSSLDNEMKSKVINYFLEQNDLTLIIASHDSQWESNNIKVIPIGE